MSYFRHPIYLLHHFSIATLLAQSLYVSTFLPSIWRHSIITAHLTLHTCPRTSTLCSASLVQALRNSVGDITYPWTFDKSLDLHAVAVIIYTLMLVLDPSPPLLAISMLAILPLPTLGPSTRSMNRHAVAVLVLVTLLVLLGPDLPLLAIPLLATLHLLPAVPPLPTIPLFYATRRLLAGVTSSQLEYTLRTGSEVDCT